MKIFIYHASAGEGHRRAALAVETALKTDGVNAADIKVADALDYSTPFFKSSYNGFYFWCVKNVPKLWGVFYELLDNPFIYALLYPVRRFYNAANAGRLLEEVKREAPNLIICTHFLSAEVLGHARKHGQIDSKVLVLVTDFHPVRVWAHDGIDAYWVLSDEARQTLIARGTPADRITSGGFPIMPEFQTHGPKADALKKHNLSADRLTVLLTTGSFGLGEQKKLLELFSAHKERLQCLVVCGRNQALFDELKNQQYAFPVRVFGFVNFMSELMDAADIMVAKPGGATTAEAMSKGVPMIATGAIPGQETRNLDFLLRKNAVFSADTPEEIALIVGDVVGDPSMLDAKRKAAQEISYLHAAQKVAQLRNKLVF